MELVRSHNPEKEGYSLSLNKFADLTPEEFSKMKGFKMPDVEFHDGEIEPPVLQATSLKLPSSVDWVAAGAVTSVKYQGSCGGCFTFAAAAAMEGIYQIKNGDL